VADANDQDVFDCMQDIRLTDHGFVLDKTLQSYIRSEDAVKADDWCQTFVSEQTKSLGPDVMACLRLNRAMWPQVDRQKMISSCQKSTAEYNAKLHKQAQERFQQEYRQKQIHEFEAIGVALIGFIIIAVVLTYRRRIARAIRDTFIWLLAISIRLDRARKGFFDSAIKEAQDRVRTKDAER
jgi:hypothetical protein